MPKQKYRTELRRERKGVPIIHAAVRTYSGPKATQLSDRLQEHKSDVEALLRKVPGLMSYIMARSDDSGVTVTTCKDKKGTDDSLRVAREWISKNVGTIGASALVVTEGAVIAQITQ